MIIQNPNGGGCLMGIITFVFVMGIVAIFVVGWFVGAVTGPAFGY